VAHLNFFGGVFRVKKITILHIKNIFFPIAEGGATFFGVFRVKNHDFTPKKSYFFPILGCARTGCAPLPGSAPDNEIIYQRIFQTIIVNSY
jgi:hypothetical protein